GSPYPGHTEMLA
ncbi:MAG: hypothetical protein GW824_11065, partial [Deltaproteobacteria bacterium]|nr:hypothetical protein [Deltaproteobacteria bacterium]